MKKLLLLAALVVSGNEQIQGYSPCSDNGSITVKNDTDGDVRVQITSPSGYCYPNGGDILAPGKPDSWSLRGAKNATVTFIYPDKKSDSVKYIDTGRSFRVFKSDKGYYTYAQTGR